MWNNEKEVWYFLPFFFELFPKLIDFVNSDDSIRKITSKSIRIHPVIFYQKKIFSCEKMWNSDIYIYNYAHSFFGKDV